MRWWILVCGPLLVIAVPRFDPTALLKNVLVPADAAAGSVVYRLRASDPGFDYPLLFELSEENTVVAIETLNCTRFNSVCQANVVLRKKLEAGRFYDFRVVVSNKKRETVGMECSFRATNATTPIERIFPGAPSLFTISESARRNSELGTIIARGNPLRERPVLLELWGSPQFSLRQRLITDKDAEGTVILLKPLDYEKSTVHNLTVFANDPWAEPESDSRNIASWPLLVSVWDEQDTPPIFILAPPTTALDPGLKPGDNILSVRAEDGDRGNPRDIRYALVAEDNPYYKFFNISEDTGVLQLVRPLSELQAMARSKSPILLTVLAEEVRSNDNEGPAQSSTVQLALIPPSPPGTSPQFSSKEYSTTLDENSPSGTVLNLDKPHVIARPGVVLTLQLLNNNGTFDISPNVIEGKSKFTVKVKNSKLLDYESRHSVQCDILAKEIGEKSMNFSATSHLVVYLNDVNDNTPIFRRLEWKAELPENADFGSSVVKIEANDTNDAARGNVRYIRLMGSGSEAFNLDSNTGLITVAKPQELDSERTPVIQFYVEAADENGFGNTATSTVIVDLVDINDEVPKFEKNPYEFIFDSNRQSFTVPAFVKANDNDTSAPNNVVRYELIEPIENLTLDAATGELTVKNSWTKSDVTSLHVRAYDGGVPRLWSETEIRLYPPESKFRTMMFVVSGRYPDREQIAKTLTAIVGGKVTIDEVRPYSGNEGITSDVNKGGERSVIIATVPYSQDAVVDVEKIQRILDQRNVREETTIQKAEGPNLWWLFWTLLVLAIIAAIIAILCCICEGCPWYVPPRKKTQVRSAEVSRLVIHGSGHGKESKSVQVAEWFGRREAWTPEAGMADVEADSLRRHEMERGSDRGGARRMQRQHHAAQEVGRDQLYIREGNADILRLITRGNDQQRPVTLVQEQPYVIDSGKDILLRRFIDQQQNEAARGPILLPNAVNKIQAENEMLEASLRQQNALLRQLLLEREREIRLETQSLPAGTQTDQDAGTQTEPLFLRPPRRKTRSDNDASDFSDEEEAKYRRKSRRAGRVPIKRKINTPIQEESETNLEMEKQQKSNSTETRRLSFGHTRTSLLRKKAAEGSRAKSRSALRREVLKEISASLLQSDDSESDAQYKSKRQADESFSDDSLDYTTPRSEKGSSTTRRRYSESSKSDIKNPLRYHSESDLRSGSLEKQILNKEANKSQSQMDLRKSKTAKKSHKGSSSRYMEWYKKGENGQRKRTDGKETVTSSATSRTSKISKRVLSDTQAKKKTNSKNSAGPEHPLLQHSEHRFEVHYPRRPEDDVDSGIALTRPAMAQKKSVFTIAYDDMQTRQLRQDSATPPY